MIGLAQRCDDEEPTTGLAPSGLLPLKPALTDEGETLEASPRE